HLAGAPADQHSFPTRRSSDLADLGTLDEVRRLADTVIERHDRLDLLINNAGIWAEAGEESRRTSADGHELIFAVNYLAGFLLTQDRKSTRLNSSHVKTSYAVF